MRAILLALALGACASAPTEPSADAQVIVAAERAFAARAGEIGWIPAFREYAAPEGRMGQPGYPNALATLPPDDGVRTLQWWPAFAGIARSGDFGFTTGPVSFDAARTPRGHYFTVWRKQPDGAWKWIYDGGVGPIADPDLIAPDAASVPSLPVAHGGAGSAEAAIAAVRTLEQGGDFAQRFAPEAQIFRTRQARAIGPAGQLPTGLAFTPGQIEASATGDLVMVLGEARWPTEAGEAVGLYARMWQHRPEGWRIVYDQMILPRPPPRG